MFLTPPEIQHQPLKGGRGYDRGEVDGLLEQAASSYEQVWLERDELRARLDELERELAGFRETERYLRETLVTAQRTADELRAQAASEAERVRVEAMAELGRAKDAAQRELEQLRAEVERFRGLELELRANLRAFLEEALRQIADDGGTRVQPPAETLADALAPERTRVEPNDG